MKRRDLISKAALAGLALPVAVKSHAAGLHASMPGQNQKVSLGFDACDGY